MSRQSVGIALGLVILAVLQFAALQMAHEIGGAYWKAQYDVHMTTHQPVAEGSTP